jgi:hypothetical protein
MHHISPNREHEVALEERTSWEVYPKMASQYKSMAPYKSMPVSANLLSHRQQKPNWVPYFTTYKKAQYFD